MPSASAACRGWAWLAWARCFRYETVFLAANLLRRTRSFRAASAAVSAPNTTRDRVAEVCACWWIAVKMQETMHDDLHGMLCDASVRHVCTDRQVLAAEAAILTDLRFDLVPLGPPKHRHRPFSGRSTTPPRMFLLCFLALGWHRLPGIPDVLHCAQRCVVPPVLQIVLLHTANRCRCGVSHVRLLT